MTRRVKEFVDIGEHASLEDLIARLSELRDTLPDGSEAELRLRGDEVFGRRISISYFREQTAEEAECEARYAHAGKGVDLEEQAEAAPLPVKARKGTLRIVA